MAEKNPEAISICLNCYKIRFNEKNKSTTKSVPDVFGKDGLIDIMNDFIKIIDTKSVFKTKSQDRILYLRDSLKASKKESVYAGVIMKGHNGTQTFIDELEKKGVKTVGTITKDQFSCIPYFFLIYMNKAKPDDLIFIAQSYKQYGFKEVFEEAFRTFTVSISEDTSVQFNTLSIAKLFEQFVQEGTINKMRFIKHGLQAGTESVVSGDEAENSNYEMEMSIKSKQGFMGIKKSLKYNDASFIEQVQIQGFDFDEAFADIIIGGRRRVVNVSKPTQFSAAYDITHNVKIDPKTNLPDFADVLKSASEILNNDLIPYL